MSEGEIKCIGVSADLKNRFGEGYKLAIQVAKGTTQKPADSFVREIAPGAILLNHLAGTRNYQVSKDSISLRKAFEELDKNKERLNITDWAITNTTLEEVFLRISAMSESKKDTGKNEAEEGERVEDDANDVKIGKHDYVFSNTE